MSLSFYQYQLYKPIKMFHAQVSSASWLKGNDCSIATATFTCALHQSERKEAVQSVANCYLQCETNAAKCLSVSGLSNSHLEAAKILNWVHGGRPIFVAWITRTIHTLSSKGDPCKHRSSSLFRRQMKLLHDCLIPPEWQKLKIRR